MKPELDTADTWSFRGGRQILEEKGLLDELPEIAAAYVEHGGGNQNLAARAERLDPLNWDQSASATFSVSDATDGPSRRADFNAYKDGVLVEHERGEQMRANWHLLKMEAAYRDPDGFDRGEAIEAGVLLLPSHVNFPTLDRTKDDVRAVLANSFDFSLPLFVWQYPTEER
ncbi:hypothetical protein [Halobellus ordinarius]|uniref:hypothetical protein n=1 Tax=Halobellus ordinarius TaxID=3075120 RepID=UPI0028807383|nr:hypothetical protein [Halobellus sp. ZY16]